MDIEALHRSQSWLANDAPAWCRIIWRTPASFNWFLKDNRKALADGQAIVKLGREWFVNSELFPTVAKTILEGKAK